MFGLLIFAIQAQAAFQSCAGKIPEGFKYQKTQSEVEMYLHEKNHMNLSIKCFGTGVRIADIKNKLGTEVSMHKLEPGVEYFDLHAEGVITRTYLVENTGKLNQLTFVTNTRFIHSIKGLHDTVKAWVKTQK